MKNSKTALTTEKLENLLRYLKKNQRTEKEDPESNLQITFIEDLLKETTFEESIKNKVKIAILKVKGRNNPNPDKLPDEYEMSNLEFSDIQYMCLVDYLNEIIHKSNTQSQERIYLSEVLNYDNVKECYEDVEEKCYPKKK